MTDAGLLERLIAPPAVTIVGASPNGHITHHLLRNLENRSCRFLGEVHLVNPNYSRIFDRRCIPSPADVPGDPGLVYLQIRGDDCLAALEALPALPHGVILFPEGSREPGGYEEAVAAWGVANDVAVLGPQSNGLVSLPGRVHGLLVPVVEDLVDGRVAILAQSGGILGGIVKYLAQMGVGLHAALEFGTAAMLTPERLAAWLLAKPEIAVLGIYADGVSSIGELAAVLRTARDQDKAVVLMIGGSSDAGRAAAASHSGMAATPRRLVAGMARQFGAILADTLDEFVWAIEAVHEVGYVRPAGPDVAVFSDSGGGGIAMADALAHAGVGLPEPAEGVHEDVSTRFGAVLNPFDFGSANMGHVREQRQDVLAVAADQGYGMLAFASAVGLGVSEQSVHLKQLDEFLATAADAGCVPVVASPFPYLPDEDLGPRRAVVALGSSESAAKLKALSIWSGQQGRPRLRAQGALTAPVAREAIAGDEVRALLSALPLLWPAQVVVSSVAELDDVSPLPLPVYVKSEAGLAHRARMGGVLGPIDRWQDVRNAVHYMLERFQGPVSVAEALPHADDYFVGALRNAETTLILLGGGGAEAESADVRLAPLSTRELRAFAELHAPVDVDAMSALLGALQEWLLASPWVDAVDLNPVVPRDGGLAALDAKIHGAPPAEAAALEGTARADAAGYPCRS